MMPSQQKYNRRDLLKLLAIAPAAVGVSSLVQKLPGAKTGDGHVIIIVFDAWSAENMRLYGYQRDTMPNLEKAADNAVVYHRHYAGGNFTVPGTASILTGLYPFTHRALSLGGRILQQHQDQNIFRVFHGSHRTVGYAQNQNADTFLDQAGHDVDKHIPFGAFNLNNRTVYDDPLFVNDQYAAMNAFENGIIQHEKGLDGSLMVGPAVRLLSAEQEAYLTKIYGGDTVGGLPDCDEKFTLANVVNGCIQTLNDLKEPSLVYFHFFPPHKPNYPYPKYLDKFSRDNFSPIFKPEHPMVNDPVDYKALKQDRLNYDAFMASWDEELARLLQFFESSGLRSNSHIFITSDHGEFHERGIAGHTAPMHYEPVVHVPLIVFSPDVRTRVDVHEPTSNVDLLPTIAQLANLSAPSWVEGRVLPHFAADVQPERPIYTFDAVKNSAFGALTRYTLAVIRGNAKLIRYKYPEYDTSEFYLLDEDPEEMDDLLLKEAPPLAEQMKQEADDLIENINRKGHL